MCGIVGVIGQEPVATVLMEGLRRLEYRGYDSAGVATLVNGSIERRARKESCSIFRRFWINPAARRHRHRSYPLGDAMAFRTRSCTPHVTGKVALVHNGIIENYRNCAKS